MKSRPRNRDENFKGEEVRVIAQERALRSQDEIIASWKWDGRHPVVSICCAAYNHEGFIGDALNGFLMQETEFPIEILVNDDASSDSTADIIREYERMYPLIVKPTYQSTNQYCHGKKPLPQLHARSKGEYIAVCEGDDFWTDPRKLAIQVAFLVKNPAYVMSSHNARVIDGKNRILSDAVLPCAYRRDFSSTEMVGGRAWVLTLSWVFRNISIECPAEMSMVQNGDVFYLSLLGQYGKCKFHSDIEPACYRVHDGGVWSTLSSSEQKAVNINAVFWLYRYYARGNLHRHARECWNTYALRVIMNTPWLMSMRGLVRIVCERLYWALAGVCRK